MYQINIPFYFLTVSVETHCPRMASWLQNIAALNPGYNPFPEKACCLQLQLEEWGTPNQCVIPADPEAFFAEVSFLNSPCYYNNGRFYSQGENDYLQQAMFDLDGHRLQVNLGGAYLRDEASFAHTFFALTSRSFIFPFYGLVTLHGAVIAKDDKIIFLTGPGGGGKTTTAMYLSQNGYSVLSDDSPLFTFQEGQSLVLPSLDYCRVTEHVLELLPSLQPLVNTGPDYAGKYMISARTLQNDRRAESLCAQITHYVQLSPDKGDKAALDPSPKEPLVEALLREKMVVFRDPRFDASQYPFNTYTHTLFQILTQVIMDANTYILQYPRESIAELPQIIENMI